MLTEQDLKQLEDKGISPSTLERQLQRYATGFPQLEIKNVATVGCGIARPDRQQVDDCLRAWTQFKGTIEKFVPASGAASRMFKDLYAFINSGRTMPETAFEHQFFDHIGQFAFFPVLNACCVRCHDLSITQLLEQGRHADVARCLLDAEGLNYGALPKGLLLFHRTRTGAHTPVEEHLEEGAQYAADAQRTVRLHFTVSPEHRHEFERLLDRCLPMMQQVWGVTYAVTMSEQSPATDTIAVTTDNHPCRNADGTLLLRPAGHGALLKNLNERQADVVFIKNIDNVVPQSKRGLTRRYKRVLAGYLIRTQARIAGYLRRLEGECTSEQLAEMLHYLEHELCTVKPDAGSMEASELAEYLRQKFNRPIRVCGMVKNEGEPGGGPYLARNNDGTYSPQILEAAQIDTNDPETTAMMQSGTHFNPVDLVCYLKDYRGQKFDLMKYVDHNTGLISEKSKDGVAIRALELPGLWNGAMSDWNTIFVEVPIETFNPVKTVNDLLRAQHQG